MRRSVRSKHPQYVITLGQILSGGIATLLCGVIGIHSVDVRDDDEDTAGKDEQKRYNAKYTDNIEPKEDVWKG